MTIAVYTLTRDRLEYTQHCFESLQNKSGVEYNHYVFDNGSTDGTADWLRGWRDSSSRHSVVLCKGNIGISAASNHLISLILAQEHPPDLIVKFDNDCEVVSDNILGQFVEIYTAIWSRKFNAGVILSPRICGIDNQPYRERNTSYAGRRIGITGIVGGLFRVVPRFVYERYRYPETLPLARGQDDHFCDWASKHGCEIGYVEGLIVNHYETTRGQIVRYPEYFQRKWLEEKEVAPDVCAG